MPNKNLDIELDKFALDKKAMLITLNNLVISAEMHLLSRKTWAQPSNENNCRKMVEARHIKDIGD